jgi:hypothetical protein
MSWRSLTMYGLLPIIIKAPHKSYMKTQARGWFLILFSLLIFSFSKRYLSIESICPQGVAVLFLLEVVLSLVLLLCL